MEIQKNEDKNTDTIIYRDSPIFLDSRNLNLGARILSSLEKLHLIIKKLKLKIINPNSYLIKAHSLGIPIKGIENLKGVLFALEANFEELQAIDFKKGCFIGQENTARMKLKNKLRKKLFALKSNSSLEIGSEITLENNTVGKLLISNPYPFGLLDTSKIDLTKMQSKEVLVGKHKAKIIL